MECLKEDGISISDIVPLTQYSVVDIERPGICVDRLDGVLHTNLIWLQTWEIEDVRRVYRNMKKNKIFTLIVMGILCLTLVFSANVYAANDGLGWFDDATSCGCIKKISSKWNDFFR